MLVMTSCIFPAWTYRYETRPHKTMRVMLLGAYFHTAMVHMYLREGYSFVPFFTLHGTNSKTLNPHPYLQTKP